MWLPEIISYNGSDTGSFDVFWIHSIQSMVSFWVGLGMKGTRNSYGPMRGVSMVLDVEADEYLPRDSEQASLIVSASVWP